MNTFTDNLSVGAHTSGSEKNSTEIKPNPIPKDFENRLSTVIEQAAACSITVLNRFSKSLGIGLGLISVEFFSEPDVWAPTDKLSVKVFMGSIDRLVTRLI